MSFWESALDYDIDSLTESDADANQRAFTIIEEIESRVKLTIESISVKPLPEDHCLTCVDGHFSKGSISEEKLRSALLAIRSDLELGPIDTYKHWESGEVHFRIILERLFFESTHFESDAHNYVSFTAYSEETTQPYKDHLFEFPYDLESAIQEAEQLLEFFKSLQAERREFFVAMHVD